MYLPPLAITETVFPKAWSKDLYTSVRLIQEQYVRIYPKVFYQALLKSTTPVQNNDYDTPVGAPGYTQFDPLYGEAVAANMTTIVQPHLSGEYQAANPELYAKPFPLNMRMFRSELETDLHKYGFDKVRELICTIPTVMLDRGGITVMEGDKFWWDGRAYKVESVGRDEYWHNTNVQLFVTFQADAWRAGS
jgi:hypothetical protein